MVIKNFKRVELKYRIDSAKLEELLNALNGYIKPDRYFKTSISSAYLDAEDWDIISRSIEKPMYKEKVRIRCYGKAKYNDPVFLELKKKYDGVVYKRRVVLSRLSAEMFLQGKNYIDSVNMMPLNNLKAQNNSLSPNSIQIAREIMAFMERHNKPCMKVITRCDRTSYVLNDSTINSSKYSEYDKKLRLTIDSNLKYCELKGSEFNYKEDELKSLIPQSENILEIKCVGGIPVWLNNILCDKEIYPSSFSKCGTAVTKIFEKNYKDKGDL